MVNFKLKSVQLRNWAKFRSANVAFPDSGLVIVTGSNLSSNGSMQSIGSGKTVFGEAFSRALFGVRGRKFTHTKDYSRDKAGDTYVKVIAEYYGKELIVESGYKCKELSKNGDALRFTYDGKQIERGQIAETRQELLKLLGMTTLLASWTVFLDGRKLDFSELTQADSVDLLMTALRQPPWSEYYANSKNTLNALKQSVLKDEALHGDALRNVQSLQEGVEDAVEVLAQAKEDQVARKAENERKRALLAESVTRCADDIKGCRERQSEIKARLKELENEKAEANHALEVKVNDINEVIRKLEVRALSLKRERDSAFKLDVQADTALKNCLSSDRACPTCRRPMGDKPDPNHVAELKEAKEGTAARLQEEDNKCKDHAEVIRAKRAELAAVQREFQSLGAQAETSELSEDYAEQERKVAKLTTEQHQAELTAQRLERDEADSEVTAAETTLAERKRALNAAKKSLAERAESLAQAQTMQKVTEYWTAAFGPNGIPTMVLKEAIAPMNQEARRLSALMSGGTIEVKYSTNRALATGQEKTQLNVEVINKLGCQDLDGNSKGESGMTNLIIAETLSEVGQVSRNIGYRWYDEVLPNQDPRVCRSIYSYLKEQAHKLGILIFMVDHNPAAINYADYLLHIEKKGTGKHVECTAHWKR